VAGCAVPVTLATRVGLRISAEESLERCPNLRLAAHGREDQDSLEGVYQVGEVPDVLGTADRPRDHVGHPGHAHHDDELHADAAQRCPETRFGSVVRRGAGLPEGVRFHSSYRAIDWLEPARVNERTAGDHELELIANRPLGISLLFALPPSCVSDVCKCDIVPRNYLSRLYPRA